MVHSTWDMSLGNDAKEYAKLMVNLYYGDKRSAKTELFNSSRAHPYIKCSFFMDVIDEIDKL